MAPRPGLPAADTAVWDRVADRVAQLNRVGVLLADEDRRKDLNFWIVEVGRAVSNGDPVDPAALKHLAGGAIAWAIAIEGGEQ